jgi:hypothetical protein
MKAYYDLSLYASRLLAEPSYFRSRTDRQLRELNRDIKEAEILLPYFTTNLVNAICPQPPLTKRKEKRIQKKLRRRTERFLKQTKQGETSLLVNG